MTQSRSLASSGPTPAAGGLPFPRLRRAGASFYGLAAYLVGLASVGGLMVFLIDLPFPYSIDRGPDAPLAEAVCIDLALLLLFGVQHTAMARPTFKRWWARWVPASVERSTYLVFTAALLALMFTQWRPIPALIWDLEAPLARAAAYGLYGAGWVTVLVTTFLIDHFQLMGLRQTCPIFRRVPDALHTPWLYRWVRHPMMTGWIVTFWATPTMTAGHLLLAVSLTAYIRVALFFEERTLLERFGEGYAAYRREVPMLFPSLLPRRR